MTDLLRPIEDEKTARSEREARARAAARAAAEPPQLASIFDLQGKDGCGNCGQWQQRSRDSVIGNCQPKGWLTSFAARCADHQALQPRGDVP